ncbi:MAG: TVP38/TMEM64 family protein [Deltaproteobacteria bacterium]|nr:TVP38/TMEM64 family protein [Deltaproteobacteria bacterium]
MVRGKIKFIILLAFLAAALISIRLLGLGEYIEQERLRHWIDGFGVWGPLVYILIYAIAASLMVPGLPVTVAGGILFGPVRGSIYVLTGATLGASLAFFIARRMGREWVESALKGGRLGELDEKVREQGWKIVAITRLIPLFPYNFLNYAYGLTSIRFSQYLLATFVFMIPGVVAYVVFSSSILDLFKGRASKEFIIGVILVIIVSLLPLVYKRFRGKKG